MRNLTRNFLPVSNLAMADDFVTSQGKPFLAHRLRRTSDRIVEQIGTDLVRQGLRVPPRGASMLMLVDEQAPIGVVEISRRLRLSHPLIVRMAQQLVKLELVRIEDDQDDARRKQLITTGKGHAEAKTLRAFNTRIAAMFDQLFTEIDCDVIAMLDRFDAALAALPLDKRLVNPTLEDPDAP